MLKTMAALNDPVRIGILGDFNPEFRSHHATTDSIQHAARKLAIEVESTWLPTPSLLDPGARRRSRRLRRPLGLARQSLQELRRYAQGH